MNLENFKNEIKLELFYILQFWLENSFDRTNGGFIGRLNNHNIIDENAEKGGVLNARILWTFSAAYNFNKDHNYLESAERAFQYMIGHFRDNKNNGIYWSLDKYGNKFNTRKQIYAQAFAIYGLSEYYKTTKNIDALNFAIELFESIELHSFDKINNGYFEAFSENWSNLSDLRLSDKDRNDPKTMNTHLHIIEAYASLYQIWRNEKLRSKIENLLIIFEEKIINHESYHLGLFFDEKWNIQSNQISYGHDIEASWLLLEVANVLESPNLITKWKDISFKIAEATQEGLNEDGSLKHEFNPTTNHVDTHKEWWVSAEAMVGYLNIYQLTKNDNYLLKIEKQWNFIQKYLLDQKNGEWFWGVLEDNSVMKNEDKIGFWKCPYHNVRACLEIIKRIDNQV